MHIFPDCIVYRILCYYVYEGSMKTDIALQQGVLTPEKSSQSIQSPKELQKLEIQKKISKKFGDKVLPKKKQSHNSNISEKAKKKISIGSEDFGDIKSNKPDSDQTRQKLKALLKTGAFHFNDKERSALSDILK